MYRFLRKMRRNLIPGRRFTRYLLYAVGEIVLVVIGILIALQINNWNQTRQKSILFNNSLEQLYNSIKTDTESLMFGIEYTKDQIALIDQLLRDPEYFQDQMLPGLMYYLDQDFDLESHNRETAYLIRSLQYDPSDFGQRELAKELTAYSSFHSTGRITSRQRLTTILESHHIPDPVLSFGFGSFDDFNLLDKNYFNQKDIERTRGLIRTEELRGILLSMRSQKLIFVEVNYATFLEDGLSILRMIKVYNPEVKLLHKDVGILGTAFPQGWEKSVPMKLTDAEKNIWEIDTFMNEGAVKFRSRDSWVTNWGGKTFPKGKTIYFGDNIEVGEAGRYHVTLNLSENTYEFMRHNKPMETKGSKN
jgi:hypothetical protein